jgi:hypothetical protein
VAITQPASLRSGVSLWGVAVVPVCGFERVRGSSSDIGLLGRFVTFLLEPSSEVLAGLARGFVVFILWP